MPIWDNANGLWQPYIGAVYAREGGSWKRVLRSYDRAGGSWFLHHIEEVILYAYGGTNLRAVDWWGATLWSASVSDTIHDLCSDSTGDFFVSYAGSSGSDIRKYSIAGDLLWTRNVGIADAKIEADAAGNVWCSGGPIVKLNGSNGNILFTISTSNMRHGSVCGGESFIAARSNGDVHLYSSAGSLIHSFNVMPNNSNNRFFWRASCGTAGNSFWYIREVYNSGLWDKYIAVASFIYIAFNNSWTGSYNESLTMSLASITDLSLSMNLARDKVLNTFRGIDFTSRPIIYNTSFGESYIGSATSNPPLWGAASYHSGWYTGVFGQNQLRYYLDSGQLFKTVATAPSPIQRIAVARGSTYVF